MSAYKRLGNTVTESRPSSTLPWWLTRLATVLACVSLLGGALSASAQTLSVTPRPGQIEMPSRDAPEIASGFRPQSGARARDFMAVIANPHGTQAALVVLEQGGTAVDAAVAAQMVLNVVEPQSSGLGGGGFILYYHAATEELVAFDGRETAPMQAWGGYLHEVSPGS